MSKLSPPLNSGSGILGFARRCNKGNSYSPRHVSRRPRVSGMRVFIRPNNILLFHFLLSLKRGTTEAPQLKLRPLPISRRREGILPCGQAGAMVYRTNSRATMTSRQNPNRATTTTSFLPSKAVGVRRKKSHQATTYPNVQVPL